MKLEDQVCSLEFAKRLKELIDGDELRIMLGALTKYKTLNGGG